MSTDLQFCRPGFRKKRPRNYFIYGKSHAVIWWILKIHNNSDGFRAWQHQTLLFIAHTFCRSLIRNGINSKA